jgi:integrase
MSVKVKWWKGAWWLFIYYKGRRKAKRVGAEPQAKKAAEVAAIKILARLAEGDLSSFDARPAPATFAAYAQQWVDTHVTQACKFSTARIYALNLRRHVLPVLGARPVGQVTRADCRALIAACRAKGHSPKTIENVCRTLSSVLSQAVEDGLLAANPAMRLGRYYRQGDCPTPEVCPLTRQELRHFLATAQQHTPWEYPLWLCATRTGLRLGELIALQWGDLDFHGRFIEVRHNRVRGRATTPKGHKRHRVDMSAQLAETLKALHTVRKEETLRRGWGQVPVWVFCSETGGPLDGDNLRKRVFYKLLEKAGLRHIRIHDLRHTFASLLLQNGESLKYIQEQLGHSSIQITMDIYGHLIPGANRGAVDRLDDATGCNPDATGHEKGATA